MTDDELPVDLIGLVDGRVVIVHPQAACGAGPCPVHAPSDHPLRDAPLSWRSDKRIMERVCEHDVGHPDPDDLKVRRGSSGVHGCDGCCTGSD